MKKHNFKIHVYLDDGDGTENEITEGVKRSINRLLAINIIPQVGDTIENLENFGYCEWEQKIVMEGTCQHKITERILRNPIFNNPNKFVIDYWITP
jgi:hypothetical protein